MGAYIVEPTPENIALAAERLRRGELVAFPTETVYGLGANALNADAVARIFAAKGRPSTNPLIVHVPDADAARSLSSSWPDAAQTLADAFWPGPLTLVVEKTENVPSIVTAGGPTVGIRVPDHAVALALLRAAGVPVAAPSANRSEAVSPTTARHVADSLGKWVDDLLVLDGGPSQVGIESTVVDVTGGEGVVILRPGMVSAAMLAGVVRVTSVAAAKTHDAGEPSRSPGQQMRHYAPEIPVLVVPPAEISQTLREGDAFLRLYASVGGPGVLMWQHPEGYAQGLYRAFHSMEELGFTRIVVEEPPHTPEWEAIHDRLRRASAAPNRGSLGETA